MQGGFEIAQNDLKKRLRGAGSSLHDKIEFLKSARPPGLIGKLSPFLREQGMVPWLR